MVAYNCNPSTGRLRQEDCWECKASTSYIVSPMSIWVTEYASVSVKGKIEASKMLAGQRCLLTAKPED